MGEFEPHNPGEQEHINEESNPKPLFELGQILSTPGAMQALINADQDPVELLHRHIIGDWGDLFEEDKEENNVAAENGFRVFSAYKLETGTKVWVITEWDRGATTMLLPDEY